MKKYLLESKELRHLKTIPLWDSYNDMECEQLANHAEVLLIKMQVSGYLCTFHCDVVPVLEGLRNYCFLKDSTICVYEELIVCSIYTLILSDISFETKNYQITGLQNEVKH